MAALSPGAAYATHLTEAARTQLQHFVSLGEVAICDQVLYLTVFCGTPASSAASAGAQQAHPAPQ